jgi:hypothetical protein
MMKRQYDFYARFRKEVTVRIYQIYQLYTLRKLANTAEVYEVMDTSMLLNC